MFKKLNLFSRTEMKLLAFVSSKDGELYERQIAKEAKVSVGAANKILREFERAGLVKKTKKGRMSFYLRNDDSPFVKQFKVLMTINGLTQVTEKIAPLAKRIVLFGSCAEGRNTEKSDIDLLIISKEKEAIRRIMDGYPIIQAIIIDSVEYAELQKKDRPLYDRIRYGIELYGE